MILIHGRLLLSYCPNERRNNGGRRPRPREPHPEPPRRFLRLRGEDPQQNDVEAAGDQRAAERPAREPRGRRGLLYVSTGRIETAQRRRIRPVRLPGESHADCMVRVRPQLALRHDDYQEEPPDCSILIVERWADCPVCVIHKVRECSRCLVTRLSVPDSSRYRTT